MGLRHVWALQSSIAPPPESIALLALLLAVATVVATYPSTDQTLAVSGFCAATLRQPAAHSLVEQLDRFGVHYNEQRPHRATGRITPAEAYGAAPRAYPAGRGALAHFRLRYDAADSRDAITLRRAGRLHHLKIGAAHARTRVLAIVDADHVTVVALDTGELLSSHLIEPHKGCWRNQRRERPTDHMCRFCRASCVAHVATHDMVGARGLAPP